MSAAEPSSPALSSRVSALEAALASVQSHVSTLTRSLSEPSALRRLFHLAAVHPRLAFRALRHHARRAPPSALYALAHLCLNAPVARAGQRRALRPVALLLLDELLARCPTHTDGMCLRGEALLPYIHYGKNDSRAPRQVLQEAFEYFDKASKNGSMLGLFLKGRWLLSMEPLHKDTTQAQAGRAYVKTAADNGCSRALVFLAHRYEYPELNGTVSFAGDLPKGKSQRERFILSFYQRAADMGDADALNDIGTSYSEGYGGLECDFDKAAEYYRKAIEKGSLHAFDNLGTHYETGMGGRCKDRIDFAKALFYYRQGARKRCPKCAYNLAAAYEEGMPGTLKRDTRTAENYYLHAIKLADDANDIPTAGKCLRDLCSLYVTRIKLNAPDSPVCETAHKRLLSLVVQQPVIDRLMAKINKAIVAALKSKPDRLSKIIGDVNSKLVIKQVKDLDQKAKNGNATPKQIIMLHHTLGSEPPAPNAEPAEPAPAPIETGRKRGARTLKASRRTSQPRKRRKKA